MPSKQLSLVFNPIVNAHSQFNMCNVCASTQLTTYTSISCIQSVIVECLCDAVDIFTTLKRFIASSMSGVDGTSSYIFLKDIQEITAALHLYI
jgi:hypothetical protein